MHPHDIFKTNARPVKKRRMLQRHKQRTRDHPSNHLPTNTRPREQNLGLEFCQSQVRRKPMLSHAMMLSNFVLSPGPTGAISSGSHHQGRHVNHGACMYGTGSAKCLAGTLKMPLRVRPRLHSEIQENVDKMRYLAAPIGCGGGPGSPPKALFAGWSILCSIAIFL